MVIFFRKIQRFKKEQSWEGQISFVLKTIDRQHLDSTKAEINAYSLFRSWSLDVFVFQNVP